MYLQFGFLECINEHQTLVEIKSNDLKTNRIALLMANPPPATSTTTMHSRLICQDRNLCFGDTVNFPGPGKPYKFLTINGMLKSFGI